MSKLFVHDKGFVFSGTVRELLEWIKRVREDAP